MVSLNRLVAVVILAACGGNPATGDDDDVPPMPDAQIDAPIPAQKFSFFVTSVKALVDLSGNPEGFGGDLRFGETGPGAGLRGADKLCSTIAERSLPGAGAKPWRAFLSAADGGNGTPVHAIDRIGQGPWFDRLERLVAPTLADMSNPRPLNGDAVIKDDFPNEDGVPNHDPDGTGDVDNHDMLTGSNAQGRLFAASATCLDWTANAGNKPVEGLPRVGHSWPRQGSGIDWRSALNESGCAPGISLIEMGPPDPNSNTVGSGGGYGGFYCFSLMP
jgi:hypothetical protein